MNPDIPALSLQQPWLWAVLSAGKVIENRAWATRYRGRIRLHASKTYDADGEYWLCSHGFPPPSPIDLNNAGQFGAYLGEATLVDILPPWLITEPNQQVWAFGPQCWRLEDIRPYPEPIPGRGYPSLYYPERIERSRSRG